MNKQEAIKGIKNKKILGLTTTYEDERYNEGLLTAIDYVEAIDEPEKPVVPQFVADWYEEHKDDFEHCLYEEPKIIRKKIAFDDLDDFHKWFNFTSNKPFETLVKMKLFGYKVEKKLYTAKLKSTGEYLRYRRESKEIYHFKTTDENANSYEAYHFTKDELRKYNAWENEVYEVNEVKK